MTTEQTSALIGVVEPPLPDMPARVSDEPGEPGPFTQAIGMAQACLYEVQERLRNAREDREDLRLEIRQLVREERLLTRMVRIAAEGGEEDE